MQSSPVPLSACIESYRVAVAEGDVVRAYRGILSQLTQFKAAWEQAHPKDTVGALYPGYLDMSFVAFAPATLAEKRLKISLVFLHPSCEFALWLAAGNRAIQKSVSEALRALPLGGYRLTKLETGVDAIIELILEKPYAFDDTAALTQRLVQSTEAFTSDMIELVNLL